LIYRVEASRYLYLLKGANFLITAEGSGVEGRKVGIMDD